MLLAYNNSILCYSTLCYYIKNAYNYKLFIAIAIGINSYAQYNNNITIIILIVGIINFSAIDKAFRNITPNINNYKAYKIYSILITTTRISKKDNNIL
jgi:hypothetical protein